MSGSSSGVPQDNTDSMAGPIGHEKRNIDTGMEPNAAPLSDPEIIKKLMMTRSKAIVPDHGGHRKNHKTMKDTGSKIDPPHPHQVRATPPSTPPEKVGAETRPMRGMDHTTP